MGLECKMVRTFYSVKGQARFCIGYGGVFIDIDSMKPVEYKEKLAEYKERGAEKRPNDVFWKLLVVKRKAKHMV
ncbi:Presequence protease 2 chloroplastic/mitochondrial [Bienertia sinuspersici]